MRSCVLNISTEKGRYVLTVYNPLSDGFKQYHMDSGNDLLDRVKEVLEKDESDLTYSVSVDKVLFDSLENDVKSGLVQLLREKNMQKLPIHYRVPTDPIFN